MALAEESMQQILRDKSCAEYRVYLTGREPEIRMSTSLLALCCQSGLDATWETPIQGPKQIEWFKVLAHVAALDRALHQTIDRSLDTERGSLHTASWGLRRTYSAQAR